jgi:preprotein translocase subunit SecE
MTDETDKTNPEQDEPEADDRLVVTPAEAPGDAIERADETDDDAVVPTQLGATRYVMAGFFAAGMAATFLTSKVLNGSWNKLTNNAWVSQHAAILSRISEDERPSYTMLVGAIVGIAATFYAYHRPDLRTWSKEVASELAKVSWPTKKEVTNSTMVVIVTSAFATAYLALMDRFWGFVTNLVYGS